MFMVVIYKMHQVVFGSQLRRVLSHFERRTLQDSLPGLERHCTALSLKRASTYLFLNIRMLSIANEADVCYARDSVLSETVNMDFRKQTINRSLQLLKWLLDARPSLTGWSRDVAKKLAYPSLDSSFQTIVVKMIEGAFWKKQLSGWKEVGAAMVALLSMVKDGNLSESALYVVNRCKHENEDLRKRMHQRELRSLADGEEAPSLESVERRDVSGEAKWSAIHAFLSGNDLQTEIEKLISDLDQHARSITPPRKVLEMLKKIPRPPGYKTLEERQEEERLMRARELAEDEDF